MRSTKESVGIVVAAANGRTVCDRGKSRDSEAAQGGIVEDEQVQAINM
jgi:hypothetical protein